MKRNRPTPSMCDAAGAAVEAVAGIIAFLVGTVIVLGVGVVGLTLLVIFG